MPTKSAVQSKTVWAGFLVALAGVIKTAANFDVTDLVATIVNNWDALASVGGGLLAAYFRIRATHVIAPKPITGAVPLIAVFCLLSSGFLTGCAKDANGNYSLDPNAKALLLSTASVEASTLAADYLQHGSNLDYKADLISGALSQVRTMEGTANPVTVGIISQNIGNVITDPALKAAVTNAALTTVNQALAGGLTKDAAIETGVTLLDQTIQRYTAPKTP